MRESTPGKNILITGSPGIGKTTLIRTVAERLSDFHPGGFYTREIREKGTRMGFEIISLVDDRLGVLAHVKMKSTHHVGKYGVDVEGFEAFLSNQAISAQDSILILDEIGKMECLSQRFRDLVQKVMDSDRILIATIALHGDAFIESLKLRKDVQLHVLTRDNRDALVPVLVDTVRDLID